MSQAGIINTTSGPVPPAVPTQFTADDGTIGIPVANNFNLFSQDTIANNDNGIETTTIANGSPNHFTQLTNRIVVTAITSDGGGQTQTVPVMIPTNATAVTFVADFVGYDSINNLSIGGEQIGLARTVGGVVTLVGTNDTFDESDAVLNTADWNIFSGGGNLSAQFVGVAGHTINWKAYFYYTQAP